MGGGRGPRTARREDGYFFLPPHTQRGEDADGSSAMIRFLPPPCEGKREAREAREGLRRRMDEEHARTGKPVRVLFDLTQCDLKAWHVEFTVRTLLKNEAYMRKVLDRSAALLPRGSKAAKGMADLFLRMYVPVRPFRVEVEESKAAAFLESAMDAMSE